MIQQRLRASALIIFLMGLAFGLGFVLFPSSGRDDAHITLWSGYSLSQYGDILNYNGQRLEQSSSLLFVLILAFFHRLTGFDIANIAYVLALLFGLGSIYLLYQIGTTWFSKRVGLFMAALLATNMPFLYWMFSKMETSLTVFTCLVVVWLYQDSQNATWTKRRILSISLASLATVLVRPELVLILPFVFFVTYAYEMLQTLFLRRFSKGQADTPLVWRTTTLWFSGLTTGAALLLLLARQVYFGQWFPQPVIAKVSGLSLYKIHQGLLYVWYSLLNQTNFINTDILLALKYPNLALLVTIILLISVTYALWKMFRIRQVLLTLSLVFSLTYLGYLMMVGGDWMEWSRQFVPFLPFAYLLMGFFLHTAFRKRLRLGTILFSLLVSIQIYHVYNASQSFSNSMPLLAANTLRTYLAQDLDLSDYAWTETMNRVNIRDIYFSEELNRFIAELYAKLDRPVVMLTNQGGFVLYYTALEHYGKFHVYDLQGLVDNFVSTCPYFDVMPDSILGRDIPFTTFVVEPEQLARDCDFQIPDIIFGVNSISDAILQTAGYELAYAVRGVSPTFSNYSPNRITTYFEWLYVRRDILEPETRIEMLFDDIAPESRSPLFMTNMATQFLLLGDIENAQTWFQMVLEQYPNEVLVYVEFADFYLRQRNYESALALLETAFQKFSNQANLYAKRAAVYQALGDSEKAVGDFTAAINLGDDMSRLGRADAYQALGRFDSALDDLNYLLRRNPLMSNTRIAILLARSQVYAAMENVEHARADLEQIRAYLPHDLRALHALTLLENNTENFSASLALTEQILAFYPFEIRAYQQQAVAYLALENNEAALASLANAMAINAYDAASYRMRANFYRLQEQTELAIADYSQAISLDDKNYNSYLQRGILWEASDNQEAALADFTAAIALNPSNSWGYIERAHLYRQARNYAAAIVDFNSAIPLAPENYNLIYWRGLSYYREGNLHAAQADFQAFLDLPEDVTNANLRTQAQDFLATFSG